MCKTRSHKNNMAMLFSGLILLSFNPPTVADDQKVSAIIESWEKRQRAADFCQYTAKGKVTVAAGALNFAMKMSGEPITPGQNFPPSDETFDQTYSLTLDFARNRARKDLNDSSYNAMLKKHVPRVFSDMYDGKNIYKYEPKEKYAGGKLSHLIGRDWTIVSVPEWKTSFLGFSDFPLLFAQGIVPLTKDYFPDVTELRQPIPKAAFRYQGTFPKRGVSCVVLRESDNSKSRMWEYWVDPNKDGAIVHSRFTVHGNLRISIDIDWQPNSTLQYIPARWLVKRYKGSKEAKLEREEELKVVSADFKKIDDDFFTIAAKPGEVILDVVDNRKSYYVSHDGSKVLVTDNPQSSGFSNLYVITPVIFLIAIGLILYVRRRFHSSPAS